MFFSWKCDSFIDWWSHRGDIKVLTVGKELWKETLPLQMGSRMYQLQGLKSHTWFEVKISYPASVCNSSLFDLLLLHHFDCEALIGFIVG